MAEINPDFGFDVEAQEQLELSGYCSALLGGVIPQLLKRSDEAQKDFLYQGVADIDIAFLAYDYLVDDLHSYRIRLVPKKMVEPLPTFRDFGMVRQVIINVPVDFVGDLRTVEDIDLALVSLYVDKPEADGAQRYVITPTMVEQFTDFADLDFNFYYDAHKQRTAVHSVKLRKPSGADLSTDGQVRTVRDQLTDVQDIFNLIKKLIIGNQSLNDGTAPDS